MPHSEHHADTGARKTDLNLGVSAGHDVIHSRRGEYEKKIKFLIGRKFLAIKGQNDHIRDEDGRVILYHTEKRLDKTNMALVVMASSQCRFVTQELVNEYRVWMRLPEYADGMHYIGDDLWIVDERLMDAKQPALAPFVWLEPKTRDQ